MEALVQRLIAYGMSPQQAKEIAASIIAGNAMGGPRIEANANGFKQTTPPPPAEQKFEYLKDGTVLVRDARGGLVGGNFPVTPPDTQQFEYLKDGTTLVRDAKGNLVGGDFPVDVTQKPKYPASTSANNLNPMTTTNYLNQLIEYARKARGE